MTQIKHTNRITWAERLMTKYLKKKYKLTPDQAIEIVRRIVRRQPHFGLMRSLGIKGQWRKKPGWQAKPRQPQQRQTNPPIKRKRNLYKGRKYAQADG